MLTLFFNLSHCFVQMVAEAAAGPSQIEEAHQASVQELQMLRDALNQVETKTKELEGQLESVNKVRPPGKAICHQFVRS